MVEMGYIHVKGEYGYDYPLNFPKDSKDIRLRMDITDGVDEKLIAVDLTGCREFPSLEILTVPQSKITELDLSPLSSCDNLREFRLQYGLVKKVNLKSIGECKSLQVIDLQKNYIEEIDFRPLAMSRSLEIINLFGNRIKEVDLSPLAQCKSLKTINLSENFLKNVDLTQIEDSDSIEEIKLASDNMPLRMHEGLEHIKLAAIPSLKKLDLGYHNLSHIDLEPLSRCSSLEVLQLNTYYKWKLDNIDLKPLSSCTKLRVLYLENREKHDFDFTPLAYCSSLRLFKGQVVTLLSKAALKKALPEFVVSKQIRIDVLPDIMNLHDVSFYLNTLDKFEQKSNWKIFHLLHESMRILEFDWLGLIDVEPKETLCFILEHQETPQIILQRLVEIVCDQIDRGGTTIGLDIDHRIEHIELTKRVKDVANLRIEELEQLVIPIKGTQIAIRRKGDRIDLRPLWLTDYGQDVLSSLGLGMSCTVAIFEKIRESIADIGVDLKITDGSYKRIEYSSHISKDLRRYWLALTKHRQHGYKK